MESQEVDGSVPEEISSKILGVRGCVDQTSLVARAVAVHPSWKSVPGSATDPPGSKRGHSIQTKPGLTMRGISIHV